jgi:hypothetical protein
LDPRSFKVYPIAAPLPGSFTGPKIGLLDRLHDKLHRFQAALIVCKLDRWMLGDLGQRRALNNNKIFGSHTQVNVESYWSPVAHSLNKSQIEAVAAYVSTLK